MLTAHHLYNTYYKRAQTEPFYLEMEFARLQRIPYQPSSSNPKKRTLEAVDAPTRKRQHQEASKASGAGDPAKLPQDTNQYVYIAIEEQYGPYMETTKEVFEVYATVEDANKRLITRQKESDHEEWENSLDEHGCFHSSAEDGEGDGTRLDVQRFIILPAGCIPALPSQGPNSEEGAVSQDPGSDGSEGEFESEDSDGTEEQNNMLWLGGSDVPEEVEVERARTSRRTNCRGCGCGEYICDSCWGWDK